MTTIRDLPSVWRKDLMPAHFDNCMFHAESGSRDSGGRMVVHEFPKKEIPYTESMGRKAVSFMVRGYCITYPHGGNEGPTLYRADYRIARDALQKRLENTKAGVLQLPLLEPMKVKCQRYRLNEEDRFGGYCTFDMTFVEAGVQPFMQKIDTQENLRSQADQLKSQLAGVWQRQRATRTAGQ